MTWSEKSDRDRGPPLVDGLRVTCRATACGGCSGSGTVAGDPGARCMECAREEAVALLRPREQAAGVPATAAPISPAAAITVAGKKLLARKIPTRT